MKTEQLCRVWWRWKVSFMYAHVSTLHTHTFEGLQSWVTNPQTLNTPPLLEIEKTQKFFILFLYKTLIGQLSQHSQHHTPSMELDYSNSCQQFSSYINFIKPLYLLVTNFWCTHWVCYPVCQHPTHETNTRHHENHALSRICETKHDSTYTSGPLHSTIIP